MMVTYRSNDCCFEGCSRYGYFLTRRRCEGLRKWCKEHFPLDIDVEVEE